jgi:hypothetical protein
VRSSCKASPTLHLAMMWLLSARCVSTQCWLSWQQPQHPYEVYSSSLALSCPAAIDLQQQPHLQGSQQQLHCTRLWQAQHTSTCGPCAPAQLVLQEQGGREGHALDWCRRQDMHCI